MNYIKQTFILLSSLCLWTACTQQEQPETDSGAPAGTTEVRFVLPGTLTTSPQSSATRASGTRADGETADYTPNSTLLANKTLLPLEEGSTLWLLIEGDTEEGQPYKQLKSYVVKGTGDLQNLYPCTVDEEGNVTSEQVAPLYLPFGTYTFRAMSPARAFLDENGEVIEDPTTETVFRQRVSNGDYLISNDERYTQTQMKEQKIEDTGAKVQFVELNPLVNQTAQLKFTIYADESGTTGNDLYIHRVEMMPAGVEIYGLQSGYGTDGELWNWSPLLADTLVAYPGKKEQQLDIHGESDRVTQSGNKKVVVETAVLPTDATSSSIIVIFNLKVNDIPTQYEMMLNLKILRAAHSYHYRGRVTIEEGIAAITWQYVSWSADVGIEF